jgi:hypothetical protein
MQANKYILLDSFITPQTRADAHLKFCATQPFTAFRKIHNDRENLHLLE